MMIKTKTSQTIEPAKHLQQKDLLGLRDLTPEEILLILNTADTMKMILSAKQKRTAHLQGKSVVTLFYENSTRTRLSFELASKFLGSVSANISVSGSSISKGENLYDTCKTIDVMATDFIIMRHPHSGAPHRMAPRLAASLVNAGDGMNEHPTQALLDMMTMREHKGSLEDLKVAIIGDITHSRVVRSISGDSQNWRVRVAGPATMMPIGLENTPAIVCHRVEDAVQDCDVVMGLRVQLERQTSAFPDS